MLPAPTPRKSRPTSTFVALPVGEGPRRRRRLAHHDERDEAGERRHALDGVERQPVQPEARRPVRDGAEHGDAVGAQVERRHERRSR